MTIARPAISSRAPILWGASSSTRLTRWVGYPKRSCPTQGPEAVQTESFEYDPNGNLVACENAAIRIERAFDAEGRLLEERQGDSGILTNTYDPNGKRLTRSIDLTLGGETYNNTIGYGYDLLDQAIGVTPGV